MIELIIKETCSYFRISETQIQMKTRKREIVQARQTAMYFSKEFTKTSLVEIGKAIGGKDHATTLYACKTIANLTDSDKNFAADIIKLRKIIEDAIKVKREQEKDREIRLRRERTKANNRNLQMRMRERIIRRMSIRYYKKNECVNNYAKY